MAGLDFGAPELSWTLSRSQALLDQPEGATIPILQKIGVALDARKPDPLTTN